MALERTYVYEMRPHRDPQRAARGETEPVLVETTRTRTIQEAVLLHRLQERDGDSGVIFLNDAEAAGTQNEGENLLEDPAVLQQVEAGILAELEAGLVFDASASGSDAGSVEDIVIPDSEGDVDAGIVVEGSDLDDALFAALARQGGPAPGWALGEESDDEPPSESCSDLFSGSGSAPSEAPESESEGEEIVVEGGIVSFPGCRELPPGLEDVITDRDALFVDAQGNLALRPPEATDDIELDAEDAEALRALQEARGEVVEAPALPDDLARIARTADAAGGDTRVDALLGGAQLAGAEGLAEAAALLDDWVDGGVGDREDVLAEMEAVREDEDEYRLATAAVNRAVEAFSGPAGLTALPPGFAPAPDGRVGKNGCALVSYSVADSLTDERRAAIREAVQRFEPIPDRAEEGASEDDALPAYILPEQRDDATCMTALDAADTRHQPRQLAAPGRPAERADSESESEDSEDAEFRPLVSTLRARDETPEERAARKRSVKEQKAARRQTKKAVREAYRQEQLHQRRSQASNSLGGKTVH